MGSRGYSNVGPRTAGRQLFSNSELVFLALQTAAYGHGARDGIPSASAPRQIAVTALGSGHNRTPITAHNINIPSSLGWTSTRAVAWTSQTHFSLPTSLLRNPTWVSSARYASQQTFRRFIRFLLRFVVPRRFPETLSRVHAQIRMKYENDVCL